MRKTLLIPIVLLINISQLALAGCGGRSNAPVSGQSATVDPSVWADRQLKGRLILIQYGAEGNTLVSLDMASGKMSTLFQAPKSSTLLSASVSPDGKQILLDYAPPPAGDGINLGYTDLYLMPLDGSHPPKPLLSRTRQIESYFFSAWAPDGNSVLYSHFYQEEARPPVYRYQSERLPVGGEPEILVANGIWPRLAPDGSRLAYLSYDPQTNGNELYLAGADGKDARAVLPPGMYAAEDAHMFTPDGQAILFSAVNPTVSDISTAPAGVAEPALSWLERWMGVQVASAHSVPSDWYRVDLNGGQPTRLTRLGNTGMYGRFSPDGKDVAFISDKGVYLMKPDGSQLLQIASLLFTGSLDWIP